MLGIRLCQARQHPSWGVFTSAELVGDNQSLQESLAKKFFRNAKAQVTAIVLAVDIGDLAAVAD